MLCVSWFLLYVHCLYNCITYHWCVSCCINFCIAMVGCYWFPSIHVISSVFNTCYSHWLVFIDFCWFPTVSTVFHWAPLININSDQFLFVFNVFAPIFIHFCWFQSICTLWRAVAQKSSSWRKTQAPILQVLLGGLDAWDLNPGILDPGRLHVGNLHPGSLQDCRLRLEARLGFERLLDASC